MPTTTEAASAAFDRLSRDIETVNRRTRAAQDSIPVAVNTDYAALLNPVGGVGGGASQSQVDALQAKVDAMPALVVVSDPAQAPAGTIAVVVAP